MAGQFWRTPNEATWGRYNAVCMPHYNRVQPANDDARRRIVFNEAILFASAGGEQRTMDLLPGLAHARCPVLVMAGELDPVCPLQDSLDLAAALPPEHLQLATFANAGHGAWRDEPDAAFARLRRCIVEA